MDFIAGFACCYLIAGFVFICSLGLPEDLRRLDNVVSALMLMLVILIWPYWLLSDDA